MLGVGRGTLCMVCSGLSSLYVDNYEHAEVGGLFVITLAGVAVQRDDGHWCWLLQASHEGTGKGYSPRIAALSNSSRKTV